MSELSDLYDLISSLRPTYTFPSASLPSVAKQSINIFRGTNWNFNISGIGTDASGFYFTIKKDKNLEDSQSELQLSKNSVLITSGIYLNTPSGSLTYSSNNNGTISIEVEPEITSQIPAGNKFVWDLKGNNESTVRAFGFINIKEDITNKF
jgi:hypothetical protein